MSTRTRDHATHGGAPLTSSSTTLALPLWPCSGSWTSSLSLSNAASGPCTDAAGICADPGPSSTDPKDACGPMFASAAPLPFDEGGVGVPSMPRLFRCLVWDFRRCSGTSGTEGSFWRGSVGLGSSIFKEAGTDGALTEADLMELREEQTGHSWQAA